jgi:hypothetical protein
MPRIQLALDVQIPTALKGREGEAVYIDTEGSFMVERVASMAQSLASHLLQIAAVDIDCNIYPISLVVITSRFNKSSGCGRNQP